jgi:hypothetical protein
MKGSFGRLLPVALAALVLASFAMAPLAEAARGGGGRGGGGAARAGAAQMERGGGAGHRTEVNNSRADVRTNNVRSTSVNNVNNVNVNRNVNVNVEHRGCCGWDNDYHPVATAAAVGATVAVTSAVVGSIVRSVPAGCAPVNYGGMVYQQCGGTWYAPQGAQYIVVNPPY